MSLVGWGEAPLATWERLSGGDVDESCRFWCWWDSPAFRMRGTTLSCPGCISMVTVGWDVFTPTQSTEKGQPKSFWGKKIRSKKIGNKQRWNENSLTSSNTTVRGKASECGQSYLVACWPVFVCCWSSWRRRLPGRPSRAGWAAGEETGCLSGRGGSRRCCRRLVLAKWSAAAPGTEICCKKKMCAIRK